MDHDYETCYGDDGTVTLIDHTDGRTQSIAAGWTDAQVDSANAAFRNVAEGS